MEADSEENGSEETQCKHTSYDLESYERVERVGWSWMLDDTCEKKCDWCHQMKKLAGWNLMYYCRSCHGDGTYSGCWTSLLLSESHLGRGRCQRQGSKKIHRSKVYDLTNSGKQQDDEVRVNMIL